MSSQIVRLVKFVDIFGTTEWLREDEANAKLKRERKLYSRFSRWTNQVTPPRIESTCGGR